MTIQEYLSSLRGKTAAVLGIGVSNTPLIELLCRNGAQVIACDKKSREDLGERAKQLEALGAHLQLGEGYLDDLRADVVFRTPGMRPDVPALLEAKARGSVVTSEMEIFFEVCPCTIIGVTGSDGKTTTTSIMAEMLRAAGRPCISAATSATRCCATRRRCSLKTSRSSSSRRSSCLI